MLRASALGCALFFASACGYTSGYVPPAGGRARLVWHDDALRVALPPATMAPAARVEGPEPRRLDRLDAADDVRSSSIRLDADVGRGGANAARAVARGADFPSFRGTGKDAAIVLVVAALVALPVISVALATGTPEDETQVSRAIEHLESRQEPLPGELTLRYDHGLEIWNRSEQLAKDDRFEMLQAAVGCDPSAAEHARAARSDASTASVLSTTGIVVGVSGVGGLGGLAFRDDPAVMTAFFGTGLLLGVTGVVLAATSRGYRNSSNGHAVDAVNYYNDAVAAGVTCRAPVRSR